MNEDLEMNPPCYEIHELRRELEIGCADDEHGVKQPLLLTLRATLAPEQLFAGDSFTPPYDYCELIQAADDAIASRPRFILQETLVVAIAARALANPLVESIEIEIAKTARYESCRAIGVRATLTRTDLRQLAPRYAEDPAVARLAGIVRDHAVLAT